MSVERPELKSCEVVIVGSGFAGSLLARILAVQGYDVVLLERGTHPRFAIGESSSPLANLLLEELCDRFDLGRIRPLTAFGSNGPGYRGNCKTCRNTKVRANRAAVA